MQVSNQNEAAAAIATLELALRDTATEQSEIAMQILEIGTMLLEKNKKYGSSATKPTRVFSKLPPLEGIKIRMDDKISRIKAGAADDDEDPILDLAGYCILYMVAHKQQSNENLDEKLGKGHGLK